ncbi:c-type cytochrome [Daejeonella oryzae]|uniref:c-type cytochrome n=1 Tax=Daejeonella oryzae TaxID=1122943 RepID=UPI00041ADD00|nr:c-type cytochrome [Daejeonella oryzae]
MPHNKQNEVEKAIISVSRSVIIISVLFLVVAGIFISILFESGTDERSADQLQSTPQVPVTEASSPAIENTKTNVASALWTAPDESTLPSGTEGEIILYGKELIAHTSTYLGPKGKVASISNGMNCQNCHLDAGTKPWGNNYSAVYSTYPKFRARSGTKESTVKRINDCFERSLNGKALDSTSKEMKAMLAYMKWLGTGIEKGKIPAGAGLEKLAFLDRAADPKKGAVVYSGKCQSCHGKNGEGLANPEQTGYLYPPLWGKNSYNDGAGLFRLSGFSGYVKNNMPLGATHENQQLSDEEAWDVAAYVNSMPRPHKDQSGDWKDTSKKPFDFPFGPYADKFSAKQHKYGPYDPIVKASKTGGK